VRFVVAILMVAGCSFENGKAVDTGSAEPDVDAMPESISRTCKYPDSALRLCIEFDDRVFTPAATDGSPYGLDASASQIDEASRGSVPAAAVRADSSLAVAETAMLDISPSLTLETWLRVPAYQLAAPIYNAGQYSLGLDGYGRVSCWIGNVGAVSPQAIGKDTWRHVACVFDGKVLALYVDGSIQRCQARTQPIPTAGTAGTKLGENLVGDIDDVRIYARALAGTEICSHADKTGCTATCDAGGPGPGGGGPGPDDD